jgi:hypothetical protein
MMRAETPNVAVSMPSVRCGSRRTTTAAHHPAAREQIGQTGEQRPARDRRQIGERVGQRGEERRMVRP